MSEYLGGGVIAGGRGCRERVNGDYYATPFDATNDILDREELIGTILEPACGEGHIAKCLVERYGKEHVTAQDLFERMDKFNVGCVWNKDFLSEKKHYDNVITNPPFKLAKEFIMKGLEIADKKLLIFAKLALLEGKERKDMFQNTPLKTVYVFSRRVATLNNGSEYDENGKKWCTTMATAWFVWEKGYIGEPILRWI